MIQRLEPMNSGRDTEIDMIEREMEGGVVVIQPPEAHEHSAEDRLGGLTGIEEHVHEFGTTTSGVPRGSARHRREPY